MPPLLLQKQVALQALNTFGLPAFAQHFLSITEASQLQALRENIALATMPRLILGGGSNLILSEQITALVLHMQLLGKQVVSEDANFYYVKAAAGETWHQFVLWTLQENMAGLENLSLIPGTVGAAPIQNIGAYGVELQDRFHALTAFDFATGEFVTFDKEACQFAYRDSVFKHEFKERMVIVDVTFALPKAWQAQLNYADITQYLAANNITHANASDVSQAIIQIRQNKLPDPAKIGNAGSFFKNPIITEPQCKVMSAQYPHLVSYRQNDGSYKLAAGWLIEQCGWKGKRLGHVGVYEKQALVLVNYGDAIIDEVQQLAQIIQADVLAHFGVNLEIEPVFA